MAQNRATIDCWSFAVCFLNDCFFFPLKKLMYSLRELVISGKTFFWWGEGGKKTL